VESTPSTPSTPKVETPPSSTSSEGTDAPSVPAEVQVGSEPVSISIPSVALTADFGEPITMEDRTINPPTLSGAYRVSGITTPTDVLPSPTAPNSVFVAGHAWDEEPAVFNDLHLVAVGDDVVLTLADGSVLTYTVRVNAEVPKSGIADYAPAWKVRPGGLVLVTCAQAADGTWPENTVVIAEFSTRS